MEQRVSLIEQSIARMTAIQETQIKQNEKIIKSIDNFSKISVIVEQNAKDIDFFHTSLVKVHNEITDLRELLLKKEHSLIDNITIKMKQAIVISVSVTTFLFGYMYKENNIIRKDIQNIQKKESKILSDLNLIKYKG